MSTNGIETCGHCGKPMHYAFMINDKQWREAWRKAGVPWREDGILCAHCCLQALGSKPWNIKESRENKDAPTEVKEGQIRKYYEDE